MCLIAHGCVNAVRFRSFRVRPGDAARSPTGSVQEADLLLMMSIKEERQRETETTCFGVQARSGRCPEPSPERQEGSAAASNFFVGFHLPQPTVRVAKAAMSSRSMS